METFEVKRGLAKKLQDEGGLCGLGKKHFEIVNGAGDVFEGSHGIMSSIKAEYNHLGKLVVDVVNERPDFDDPDAMSAAMDSRKRWSTFLDEATGYNAKQRGDKAKEFAKKASKAKSGITQAQKFMEMATNLSDEKKAEAERKAELDSKRAELEAAQSALQQQIEELNAN